MEGDRRDVIRIPGPFVSEPLVEGPDAVHSGRGRCAAYFETVFREDGEQRRQEHDCSPVDEGEIETIADTEAVETRSGDRDKTFMRRAAVHVENAAALRVSERPHTVQRRPLLERRGRRPAAAQDHERDELGERDKRLGPGPLGRSDEPDDLAR